MLALRQEFPLFVEHDAHGHVVYLDNGAVTQVCARALDAVTDWYTKANGPLASRTYGIGRAAGDGLEYARKGIAKFAGAEEGEVVLSPSRAAAMTQIARGYAAELCPGDEIALPLTEPLDVLLPWQEAARKSGAKLAMLLPDACGRIPAMEITAKIGDRTKVVVCSRVEPWFGTLAPLEALAARAKEVGAACVFDYSLGAALGYGPAQADGYDFAVLASQLSYGPRGVAAVVARPGFTEMLRPLCLGAGAAAAAGERSYRPAELPGGCEAAFGDAPAAFGFAAALDYLGELEGEALRAHVRELARQLLEKLGEVPGLRLFGNMDADEDRLPIVSFSLEGFNPVTLASFLGSRGVCVGTEAPCSLACSSYLMVSQACHIDLCAYNTPDDVDALIRALQSAAFAIRRQSYSRASC